jgi:flagellar hook-length control protein FliK
VSTNGIHSLLNLGVQNTSTSPAKAQGQQGLADFLAFFIQQTSPVPPATGAVPSTTETTPEQIAAQISPETIQALTAKIALADPKLAESLKDLSPQDFMAKIIALLQKGTPTAPTQEIKPTLTSDLATLLATQVQEQPTPPAVVADSAPAKTDLLKDIVKTLQGFQAADKKTDAVNIAGDAPEAALDPALLAQLTDKIENFIKTQNADTAGHGKADIAQLKTEILQFLKDNGLSEPVIKQYMTALTDSLTTQTVAADAPAPQETAQNNSSEQSLPAPAQQPHHAAEKSAAAPAHTAFSAPDKAVSLIETQSAKTPDNAAQQSANNSARTPANDAAPEIQSPLPQQNITAKISGMNTGASTVNALLQNDAGFSSGNFNGQSDARQTPFVDAGLLKPMTAEGLATQSFANYMTAAGSTQSTVTQQISLQLQHNIHAKIDTLSVQLNPLELGRLDIKLKFAKDGSIKAHMTVDKPETLAMLQKDSAQLEKILQQSGLAVDENALSFDLRQQNQQNLEGFKNGYSNADNNNNAVNSDNALQAKLAVETYGYITQSGVNIMV